MQVYKGRDKTTKWIRRGHRFPRSQIRRPPSPQASSMATAAKSLMDDVLGLLRIRIKKGINLAIRDIRRRSSDPYVIVKLGHQRLRTRVVKRDCNPQWNEDLTLTVSDPTIPIRLKVYDHDTFTLDDKMGDAEFSIKLFMDSIKTDLKALPSGTVLNTELPTQSNCLSKESCIIWQEGNLVQDLCLRLRNVECGEVELQLRWIDLKGFKGS